MKRLVLITGLLMMALVFCCADKAHAGQMEVLVNKLVEKGVLTPYEAQILIAEANEEAAKDLSEKKAVTAPEWTQKIKLSGDVRFRTQFDWDKRGVKDEKYNLKQRVRARIGLEGQVNDQVAAGVRVVTGSGDPRSTNQSLGDDAFEIENANLDLYYIKWFPELGDNMGDVNVWLGRFKNPMKTHEVMWDGDITPGGMAYQWMSDTFEFGSVPTNLYSNGEMIWLLEDDEETEPMLWALQGGIKMDVNSDWNSVLNTAVAYYDFANVQHSRYFNPAAIGNSPMTNSFNALGEWQHDYNILDVIIEYDAKKLFDFEMGHGIYADLVYNTDPGENDFACEIGGYLGDKKVKKPGQWKVWGNWRYIEQDAVLDLTPDSDFYGFVRATDAAGGGGTNGKGFNCGVQYAIFKNTVLCAEYYWMEAIKLDAGAPDFDYQLLQLDVKVKF